LIRESQYEPNDLSKPTNLHQKVLISDDLDEIQRFLNHETLGFHLGCKCNQPATKNNEASTTGKRAPLYKS